MKNRTVVGWSVFLTECSDGSYYCGWARDVEKEINELNVMKKGYFRRNPDKTPIKIVFRDNNLPFREAFAKYHYLREMNRCMRKRLVKTQKWNNSWILYRTGQRSIPRIRGQR
jgi:putative endonuclease